MFGGNYAPRGWAFCDGQLLAVSQNQELFSLLGTTYGGDGRTTFGLPDLRGRVPLHQGQGAALTDRKIGSKGGEENVTLTATSIPSHTHVLKGSTSAATTTDPAGQVMALANPVIYKDGTADTALNAAALGQTGGGQAHPNRMPFLCINFCIALVGIYPSRN
jgi:microcystin-dependent protein